MKIIELINFLETFFDGKEEVLVEITDDDWGDREWFEVDRVIY